MQNLLADFFFVLAVKVIVKAVCVVAELVTLAVVKKAPAARICASRPRIRG